MNTPSNTVQSSRLRPSIVWPVVVIVVGILALWLPIASSIGVARLLGWLMVFDGVFQLIHSFRSEGVGHIVWKVLIALLFLAAGIYFLMHPFLAVAVVTLALAGPIEWVEQEKDGLYRKLADPAPLGDVVLARKHVPTSNHLALPATTRSKGLRS